MVFKYHSVTNFFLVVRFFLPRLAGCFGFVVGLGFGWRA